MASVSMGRTRVVLADDEVLLREGLAGLLERSGFEVIGQCGDGAELMDLVREHQPELVLVDIRMPPAHSTEALDAARLIREQFPETAILIISAPTEPEHATDVLAAGPGSADLLYSCDTLVDQLMHNLNRIAHGSP